MQELPVHRFECGPVVAANDGGCRPVMARRYLDHGFEQADCTDGTPCVVCWQATSSGLDLWAVCAEELETAAASAQLCKPRRPLQINASVEPRPCVVATAGGQRLLVGTSHGCFMSFPLLVQAGPPGAPHMMNIDVGLPPYPEVQLPDVQRVTRCDFVQGAAGTVIAFVGASSWDSGPGSGGLTEIRAVHVEHKITNGQLHVEIQSRQQIPFTGGWLATLGLKQRPRRATCLTAFADPSPAPLGRQFVVSIEDGVPVLYRFSEDGTVFEELHRGANPNPDAIVAPIVRAIAVLNQDGGAAVLVALQHGPSDGARAVTLFGYDVTPGRRVQRDELARVPSPFLGGGVEVTVRLTPRQLWCLWQEHDDCAGTGAPGAPLVAAPLRRAHGPRRAVVKVEIGQDQHAAWELIDLAGALVQDFGAVESTGLLAGSVAHFNVCFLVRANGMSLLAPQPQLYSLAGAGALEPEDRRGADRELQHGLLSCCCPLAHSSPSAPDDSRLGAAVQPALQQAARNAQDVLLCDDAAEMADEARALAAGLGGLQVEDVERAALLAAAAEIDGCADAELGDSGAGVPPVAAAAAARQSSYRVLVLRLIALQLRAAASGAGADPEPAVAAAHAFSVLGGAADASLLLRVADKARPTPGDVLQAACAAQALQAAPPPPGVPKADAAGVLGRILALQVPDRTRAWELVRWWVFGMWPPGTGYDDKSAAAPLLAAHAAALAAATGVRGGDHHEAAVRFECIGAALGDPSACSPGLGQAFVEGLCVVAGDHYELQHWAMRALEAGAPVAALHTFLCASLLQQVGQETPVAASLGVVAQLLLPNPQAPLCTLPLWTPRAWRRLASYCRTMQLGAKSQLSEAVLGQQPPGQITALRDALHRLVQSVPDPLLFEAGASLAVDEAMGSPPPAVHTLVETHWCNAVTSHIRVSFAEGTNDSVCVLRVTLPPPAAHTAADPGAYQEARAGRCHLWVSAVSGAELHPESASGAAGSHPDPCFTVSVPTDPDRAEYTVSCRLGRVPPGDRAATDVLLLVGFVGLWPRLLPCRPAASSQGDPLCGAGPAPRPRAPDAERCVASILWARAQATPDHQLSTGLRYYDVLAAFLDRRGCYPEAALAHFRLGERLWYNRRQPADLSAALCALERAKCVLQAAGATSFSPSAHCVGDPWGSPARSATAAAPGDEDITLAALDRMATSVQAELALVAAGGSVSVVKDMGRGQIVESLCGQGNYELAGRYAAAWQLGEQVGEVLARCADGCVHAERDPSASKYDRRQRWGALLQLLHDTDTEAEQWHGHRAVMRRCLARGREPPSAVLQPLLRRRPDLAVSEWLRAAAADRLGVIVRDATALASAAAASVSWLRWSRDGGSGEDFERGSVLAPSQLAAVSAMCEEQASRSECDPLLREWAARLSQLWACPRLGGVTGAPATARAP
eukprot:TRINITY_DN1150_c0_g1_i1.p1 TRINITY_DN1150_c0_g1~~TRINITY_DN1150_c0_g1_i1.p1  ORF type:complete len:1430 (+),score=377.89 TRINITY_DN1150_c0_g1_i1:81-4370(+)